ncbi:MAG: thioredoxin family protein [Burkholderiaceae bacterium]|nr:thioredoxin family protein [Burkholderiaceae bacterium]
MAATTPVCDFGWQAPDFALPDLDGRTVTRDAARGERGLLVVFMCNHCPYVKAIVERLAADARALQASGVGVVGIMSNDFDAYPDDAPARMREFARDHDLPFPYLLDADQSVARGYGAVCTPDFFGFDAALGLQYRGRIDSSGRESRPDARRELLDAMLQVARTGQGPREQVPSIGCSIKWRAAG